MIQIIIFIECIEWNHSKMKGKSFFPGVKKYSTFWEGTLLVVFQPQSPFSSQNEWFSTNHWSQKIEFWIFFISFQIQLRISQFGGTIISALNLAVNNSETITKSVIDFIRESNRELNLK